MTNVAIFDPKNVIFSNASTFKRHEYYAKKLKEMSPRSTLTILNYIPNNVANINLQETSWLRFHTIRRFNLSQFDKNFLSNLDTVVFGDPFLSPVLFKILRLHEYCPTKVHFQIQIHGDFFNRLWIKNPRNWIKYLLLIINIKSADSLRFVSVEQLDQFKKKFPNFGNVVVAPISVTHDASSPKIYSSHRPKVVGFLGRISDDRGIDVLKKILKVFENHIEISFLILGEGDLKPNLIKYKNQLSNNSRIDVKGYVEQDLLEDFFWSQIGLLLNTAPLESYGMSMREALIRGIPILSLRTSGAMDLLNDFPEASLEFIKLSDLESLIAQVSHLLSLESNDKYLNDQIRLDEKNLNRLIESWLV